VSAGGRVGSELDELGRGSMSWTSLIIGLIAGFILGIGAAFIFKLMQASTEKGLAKEYEKQRESNVNAVIETVKTSFGSLSLDALSKAQEAFLNLAKEKLDSDRRAGSQELDTKKSLIDEQLNRMTFELQKVSSLVKDLENDRVLKFGELSTELKKASEQTLALTETTGKLREALASAKVRGQWGERMAEDVLHVAGFIENVNYLKQKVIEEAGSRPDFTFLLPQDFRLNMDVKFPLDNYIKFCEANSDDEKGKYCGNFLKDAKARIKEVTTREYINPEQNTLDYVLLFIPNEQVYRFIHEQDSSIIDYGLENRVILCSPITLFTILVVIRHAVDSFTFQQRSNEILSLYGTFSKQWGKFVDQLKQLGKKIDAVEEAYGSLAATRLRQLDRPLKKIESIRTQLGLPIAEDGDEGSLLLSEEVGADNGENPINRKSENG
jgi:DNA recombination protein RmuC